MTTLRINFASVPVADQDRAIAFYRDVLGFELTLDAPYEDGWRWIFMSAADGRTRLHFAKGSELSWQEGMPALALVSDDVDADAGRFREAGAKIVAGPDDTPWAAGARYVLLRDSEDNTILIESAKGA